MQELGKTVGSEEMREAELQAAVTELRMAPRLEAQEKQLAALQQQNQLLLQLITQQQQSQKPQQDTTASPVNRGGTATEIPESECIATPGRRSPSQRQKHARRLVQRWSFTD